MFNVCPGCGQYSAEKAIDSTGPFALCPVCGHRQPFRQLPLFVITGASGTGKSAVCLELAPQMPECVFFEIDILWRAEFDRPENDYRDFRDLSLRVAKNIAQNGRPVALCGSATPGQYEACPERRYFAALHYLALICEPDVLAERLQNRPAWRDSASPKFIERMIDYNQWFIDNAGRFDPPLTLLDTTGLSVRACGQYVALWISKRLK